MRFPWQDRDNDGKPDDHPFDTWKEIFLAWIALILTAYLLAGIADWLFGL